MCTTSRVKSMHSMVNDTYVQCTTARNNINNKYIILDINLNRVYLCFDV